MPVSLAYLEQCAADTGYPIAALEKVTRLGEIAGEISRHPSLGDVLALKGGTALNLCFGEVPRRLSVDLDYNYVGSPERSQMLAARPGIETDVEGIVRRRGYTTQRSTDAFAGRKLFVRYQSVLGPEDRVEIDLNFLHRVPLDGFDSLEMWQPGELERPRVQVVSLAELCIGKLIAMLARVAPRDAWDIGRLPEIADVLLTSHRFRRLFIAMSAMLDHPLSTYGIDRMRDQLTPDVIESQLVPMLVQGSEVSADRLLDAVWRVLEPLVSLEEAEAAYVATVHQGELRPELLFPDHPELSAMVARHPAVLWKIKNVRQQMNKGDASD